MRIIATLAETAKNKDHLGYLKAIAVAVDEDGMAFEPATPANIPKIGEVFVRRGWSEITERFAEQEFFFVEISELGWEGQCEYQAELGSWEPLSDSREVSQIIKINKTLDFSSPVSIETAIKPESINFIISPNENGTEVLRGPFQSSNATFEPDTRMWSCTINRPMIKSPEFAKLDDFCIYEIELDLLPDYCLSETSLRDHLIGVEVIKSLEAINAPQINIMTISQAIKLLETILNPRDRLGRKGKRDLIAQVEASPKAKGLTKEKVLELLNSSAADEDGLLKTIDEALQFSGYRGTTSEAAPERQVELNIEDNSNLQDEIQTLRSDIEEKNQLIVDLEKERNTQIDQIQNLSNELESQKEDKKDEKIRDLESQLKQANYFEGLNEEVNKLADQKIKIHEQVTSLEHQKGGLEESVASLKSRLTSSVSEFRTKVLDVIPFFEILNTVNTPQQTFETVSNSWEELSKPEDPIGTVAQRIIDQRFKLEKPDYARAIAAIVLSNRFVAFYSPPGSGKTALARVLARAISGNHGVDHFVPVGRGWSNPQDFIGYKNPFTNNFDFSADFWRSMAEENIGDAPARTIIFDEATLSPLEHYLSDFLSFDCLPGGEEREIFVQGKRFKFPPTSRFIFTFNFDISTEEVTERFLDRAPVIPRESNEIQPLENIVLDDNMTGLSSTYLEDFILNADARSKDSNEMLDEFEDEIALWQKLPNFNVSTRKGKQVRLFFELMKNEADNEYIRDFAASTFLLPLVRGFGQEYGEAVNEVMSETSLRRTKRRLKNIIENGRPSANYRYL